MNNDFKISIVIPCYNVENYIDRCLESVVNQTIGIEHLEIILVNDASTDSTLNKLTEWEKLFPDSIMLITYEENLRQGGARNVGLSYATGEYIGFVDSDDWIELDMYEQLASKMLTGDYDTVRCQLIRDRAYGKKSEFKPEYGGIVTGLYKRELIFGHDVFFPENISYEDNYWGPLIQCYTKSTYKIERVLYHYYVNPNSTVMRRNQLGQLDRLTIETMLLDEYIKRGFFEENKNQIFIDFLNRFYLNTWFIVFTRFDEIPDILGAMITTIEHYFPDYRNRIVGMQFSERSSLLVGMLLEPEKNNVYTVKIRWLKSWLHDQGIEV